MFDTAVLEIRDTALVGALLRGDSYDVAAHTARCSKSTVVRRMRDPEFRRKLNALRAEVLARVTDILAAETLASVATLAAVRDDPAVVPTARVRAACALLDAAAKYQAVDVQERSADHEPTGGVIQVTEIERRLAEAVRRRPLRLVPELEHAVPLDNHGHLSRRPTRGTSGLLGAANDHDDYDPLAPWVHASGAPPVTDDSWELV
jgi:hypothetical protein